MLSIKKLLSVIICIILISNFRVYSADVKWKISHNLTNVNINSVTHAGNKIDVAVCDKGMIRISSNGGEWKTVNSGTTNDLNKVVWNGKKFIVVGENGTIITSSNGLNWTSSDSKVSADLLDIICVKNRTLIMGDKGTVLISNDLKTWKSIKLMSTLRPFQVIWDGKKYIAVLQDQNTNRSYFDVGTESYIMTSNDGRKWKSYKFEGTLNTVAYSGKMYVVLGDDMIITSKDAGKWNSKSLADLSKDAADGDIYKVIWNGKMFAAIGSCGDSRYISMCSKNGANWEFAKIDASFYGGIRISDLIWTGKEFFATVDGNHPPGDPYGEIVESEDGYDWRIVKGSSESDGGGTALYDITWDGKRLIAVGNDNLLLSSSDSINSYWNNGVVRIRGDFGEGEIGDVFWNGKEFILVNCDSNIYKSQNGVDWSAIDTSIEATDYMKKNYSKTNYLKLKIANWYRISNMIYDGENFIVLDGNDTIADPETAVYDSNILQSGNVQGNIYFSGIALNGKTITTLGCIWNDNVLYVGNSSDGEKWTISKAKINIANYLDIGVNDLLYADGKYVAAIDAKIDGKENSLIIGSNDSLNWTKVYQSENQITSLAYNGTSFAASGSGNIVSSKDGINWTKNDLTSHGNVMAIGNEFYIAGSDDTLLTSSDGQFWNKEDLIDGFVPVTVCSNGKRIIIIGKNGDILYKDI